MSRRVFVTVGTTKFEELTETVTKPDVLKILKKLGYSHITLQTGSNFDKEIQKLTQPRHGITFEVFAFKDSIKEDIMGADLIISHAGAGTCIEVLDAMKPLLVVVNESLMDNHQWELARGLKAEGCLHYCTCSTLMDTLQNGTFTELKPAPRAHPEQFVKQLDQLMGF